MKRIITVVLLFCAAMGLSANPRDVGEALAKAKEFLTSPPSSVARFVPARVSLSLAHIVPQKTSSTPTAYVFQNGVDNGFVIVSADDACAPILGYSADGTFDANDIPTNLQVWLQHYAEEIEWASKQPRTSYPNPTGSFAQQVSGTAVSPLLNGIQWGQRAPFNNLCPLDSDNGKSVTGCVATAAAQVMRFWKFPTRGIGSHSYTWTRSDGTTRTVSANFGTTTYDWNNMLASYSGTYTTTQADAVATLMYHAGVACNMKYTSNESGAYTSRMLNAMHTYFGYDAATSRYNADYDGYDVLAENIQQELVAGRPVIMEGATTLDEGHCFVCEGSDGNGNFYFNWGWNGSCDGYYQLSALQPAVQGTGGASSGYAFTVRVAAYTGIQPNNGGTAANAIIGTNSFGLLGASTTTKNSTLSFWLEEVKNIGLSDWNGYLALAIYDANGNYIGRIKGTTYYENLPCDYYYIDDQIVSGTLPQLSDGLYVIRPAYTIGSSSWVYSMSVKDNPKELFFMVSGNVVKFFDTGGSLIVYRANRKLSYSTSSSSSGMRTDAFNVPIVSHDYCNGVGIITFSGELTRIGDYAFLDCYDITSITVPNGVKSIGADAFSSCQNLASIEIPNSVTTIGDGAFAYCSELTSVTIPNSVTSIGELAFGSCSKLSTIAISSNVTTIGDWAFANCSELSSITLPSGMTNIGNGIFASCFGLTSIIIPGSVTSIGEVAFQDCSNLTSITIPNSVTNIGQWGFLRCSGLKSIICEAVIPPTCGSSCFYNVSTDIPLYVPRGSVSAYQSAFGWEDFYNIKEIPTITYAADTKLNISSGSFDATMINHTFSNGIGVISFSTEVTRINGSAFSGCSGMTSFVLPKSVTSIGNYAFDGCSGLISLSVEEGNPVYDSRDNCNAIIETSSNKLICGCQNTVIPNSIIGIGNSAFDRRRGLKAITIPQSVLYLEDYAFYFCSGLTSITSEALNPPVCEGSCFTGVTKTIPLNVPRSSLSAYRVAYGWKDFSYLMYSFITFQTDEGSILWTDTVWSGEMPVYGGVIPTKPATAQYSYTFKGWSVSVAKNPTVDLRGGEWEEYDSDDRYIHYRSTNLGVHDSYYQMQIKWQGVEQFDFLYRSYAENNYDYVVINGLDKDRFSSLPSYTDNGILAHTRGNQTTSYNSASIECNTDEHFVWVCYRKDGSIDANDDRGYIAVPKNSSIIKVDSIAPASEDMTYVAQFDSIVNQYTISVVSEHGTSTGEGVYDYGSSVVLTVAPTDCHTFAKWSDGNTDNSRVVTVTGDATYTAIFDSEQYLITTAPDDAAHGSTEAAEL